MTERFIYLSAFHNYTCKKILYGGYLKMIKINKIKIDISKLDFMRWKNVNQ